MSTRRAAFARPWEERLVGGVCAGLARAFDIDVTLVRVIFVLLALAKGVGLLLYVALWVLMPQQGAGRRDVSWTARHNLQELPNELTFSRRKLSQSWAEVGERRWIAAGLVGSGVVILLWSFGAFAWLSGTRALGLAVLLLGGGLLWTATGSSEGRR